MTELKFCMLCIFKVYNKQYKNRKIVTINMDI